MTDLTRLLAHEMADGLRRGDFSARELTDAHLAAIKKTDRPLHAWVYVDADGARAQADAADKALRSGAANSPLDGIPVALKDLVLTKGDPATAGSRILEGSSARTTPTSRSASRPPARCCRARRTWTSSPWARRPSTRPGAHAQPVGPRPRARRQQRRIGSGGRGLPGAAAHRHRHGRLHPPAGGARGIVGLKPTYGRVSRYGIVAFASLARPDRAASRATCATPRCCCSAIAGRDERDSTSAPVAGARLCRRAARSATTRPRCLRGVRLGCRGSTSSKGMEPGVEARVREAVAALQAAGAEIVDVDLPHTDYGLATYYIIAPAEASANLARYDGVRYGHSVAARRRLHRATTSTTRGAGFGAEVKRRIMLGTYALSAGYYDAYYLKAQKVRTLIKARLRRGLRARSTRWSRRPARRSPSGSARGSQDPVAMYLSDACTLPVNMAGLPGLSVPCGLSEGLPVGTPVHRPGVGRAPPVPAWRAYEAITADADWRKVEPRDLAKLGRLARALESG